MFVSSMRTYVARWRRTGPTLALTLLLLFVSMAMIACSGLNFGGNGGGSTPTSTPSRQALAKLTWCGKPLLLFRDEGATPTATTTGTATATATATAQPTGTATASSTPTGTVTATATAMATATSGPRTLTDWSQVQPELDFTVYLPTTLPAHTCLVSVSGTVHDPIFGSNFIIGYLLPDHSSISLSEAPLRSQNQQFQCSPSSTVSGTPKAGTATLATGSGATATPTTTPAQLCSGAKGNTNIFFSAPGTTAQLQQFFNALQPNVDWLPASK